MNTDIRKNYHGCQNCVHQPEPLRTCDRILELDYFVARCPFWVEKKGGMRNRTDDTISRQAAIDALKGLPTWWADEGGYYGGAQPPMVALLDPEDAVSAIENLPSAQPERTCVNCGRTANNGGWYADEGTRCPIEEHYALPKDGFCHLWEKRNVTDDDYPERRTDDKTNKGSSC